MKNKVCIIGLGFVGIPMADLCAVKGHTVYGVDVDKNKIEDVKKGVNPSTGERIKGRITPTDDYSVMEECEIILICVPTPLGDDRKPDLSILKSASESLAEHIKKRQLFILESTVNPGVTEEIIIPRLEKSGLKAGTDFDVAHCPERIDTGSKEWNVENLPRVIGASSKDALDRAVKFYRTMLTGEIMPMSSIKAAEAVKVFENTFRDTNIALVNELAKAFDNIGIDFIEIIKGAATKPFGFMPFYPSAGVGGTCIPMAAAYLADWVEKEGGKADIIRASRKANDSMPEYTAKLVLDGLKKAGLNLKDTKIGILGLAYKGGIPDTRDSPSYYLIEHLKKAHADLIIFDPYVPEESTAKSLSEVLGACKCLVLLTDHPEFRDLDVSRAKVVVDGKNFLDKEKIKSKGIIYHGIGRQ